MPYGSKLHIPPPNYHLLAAQQESENVLLQVQLSVLTLISVSVPPPCYCSSIKRSQSFCQKCRWKVTAKHACSLLTWLCMKWHGAWLYCGHRTCWDGSSSMCHQPCQCCMHTTLVDIQKHAIKASHSSTITRAQWVCYIKVINNKKHKRLKRTLLWQNTTCEFLGVWILF